ncbi:MAG: hypothetical protein VW960_04915 [Pontimonas sp.]
MMNLTMSSSKKSLMNKAPLAMTALASLVILSGCGPEATEAPPEVVEEVSQPAPELEVVEEVRIPPEWTQSESPSPVDVCKVPDQRSGATGNSQAKQAVGFPVSKSTLPIEGEVNLIAAMVAFDDAPAPDLTAEDFFAPQLEKITQWSDFWSQGSLRYEFQMVEEWVTVPVNHAEYPINSRENYQQSRENSARIIQLVIDNLPEDLDYAGADGYLVYWSPGIDEFHSDVAVRGDEGVTLRTPDGPRQMFFWSGNNFHYRDTGRMTAEIKRDYTWSLWIYFLLLSQGLMLHAPGNGWPTGLGQSQIPTPDFSPAIPVWDAFRMGWVDDSQVHCVTPENLEEGPQRILLTPQEVYGGERKTIIIPVDSRNDVLVIESRRPIGATRWSEDESGLLVYTVNPSVGTVELMSQESQRSCGNTDDYSKWAYYLYPDHVDMGSLDCNDFTRAFVREGDTLSHRDLRISLDFSAEELDYVTIEAVASAG